MPQPQSFPKEWIEPPSYADPYPADAWADKVDKDIKQLKMGVAGAAGLAALAIGMAGLLAKTMTTLMQAVAALNEQQQAMLKPTAIPMPAAETLQTPGPIVVVPPREDPSLNNHAQPVPVNTAPKDRSIPDPTVNPHAEVAPVAEGPGGGEASQRVKDLLADDGPLSMKDSLPDALAVPEAAVNTEAKHANERHQS